MDLKEQKNKINLKTHWYYQSKKLPLLNFFEKKSRGKKITVIDIGAGSGFFAKELFYNYLDIIQKIYLVDKNYTSQETLFSKNQLIKKQTKVPQSIDNSFLIMMDILEHLSDDLSFLKDINKKINGENYFFVTVPAFMSLWSGHDDFLEHYRRYTLKSLKTTLESAGFQIENIYYIYGLILPFVWLKRKIFTSQRIKSDLSPLPAFLNNLLKNICCWEMNFSKFNKLGGVSCVAEGRILKKV